MQKVIQEQNQKLERQKNKMLKFSSELQLARLKNQDYDNWSD